MVFDPSLYKVIQLLPDHKDSINTLYRESEIFRSICESYQKCAEAVKHWNESNLEEAPARREEYTKLLKELEADIIEDINEFNNTGSAPN